MPTNVNGISVIICCYNSESRIPETIKHLVNQKVPSNICWEIILINNASTDSTVEVAIKEFNESINNISFSIVDEFKPGLTAARETGIKRSKYEYVLFCDDDNWLEENYISNAFQIMHSESAIGVLGGIGIPQPEPPVPKWFWKRTQHYAVGSQEISAKHNWVYGAGSVYRKKILLNLHRRGWRQITTDRIGNLPMYGGDNELCFAISLMGYKISYSDKLKFFHYIPNNRISRGYIYKNTIGSVYCSFFLYPYWFYMESKKSLNRKRIHFTLYFLKRFVKTFLMNIAIVLYPSKRFTKYQREISLLSLWGMVSSLKNINLIYAQTLHIEKILNEE